MVSRATPATHASGTLPSAHPVTISVSAHACANAAPQGQAISANSALLKPHLVHTRTTTRYLINGCVNALTVLRRGREHAATRVPIIASTVAALTVTARDASSVTARGVDQPAPSAS